MGEAQDTKLVNGRDIKISLNRPRVVREVSKALGEDVVGNCMQLAAVTSNCAAQQRNTCRVIPRR
jgi:hypothetical protein